MGRGRRQLGCLVAGILSHSGDHHATSGIDSVCKVAWLREFRRFLEIIAHTLREVVNRVRLFVCLFVYIKPENLYCAPCVWREVTTPGNGCTRNQTQTTCVTLSQRDTKSVAQTTYVSIDG